MDVHLYVAVICAAGLGLAYLIGRAISGINAVAATFAFLFVSVGLAIFLAFPVLSVVADFCSAIGLKEKACVRTDDQTVWLLGLGPLFSIPVYVVCMFVARAVARSRATAPLKAPIGRRWSLDSGIALVLCLSPLALLGWLYLSNTEQVNKASSERRVLGTRLDELCASVRIDVRRRAGQAKSVFFSITTPATFPLLEKLEFVEMGRTHLRPGDIPYERLTKKSGEPLFVRGVFNANRTLTSELEAEYAISIKLLETKDDAAKGIYVLEETISHRQTSEVLAVFTAVGERRTVTPNNSRFCPRGFTSETYEQQIVSYVLGLMDESEAKRFAKRLEAFSTGRS